MPPSPLPPSHLGKCNAQSPLSGFHLRYVHSVPNGERASHCTLARFIKAGGSSATQLMRSVGNTDVTCEVGGLGPWHWTRHDVVIGMMRNPFDWYASLWGYMADMCEWWPTIRGMGCSPDEYQYRWLSREKPRGHSAEDRKRFQAFVRGMGAPTLGLMSMHVWGNYVGVQTSPTFIVHIYESVSRFFDLASHAANLTLNAVSDALRDWQPLGGVRDVRSFMDLGAPARGAVACWTYLPGDEVTELRRCLQACERSPFKTSGVDWNAFDELARLPRRNPSSPRVNTSALYDEETVRFVATADVQIFRAFGLSRELPGV